MAEEKNRLQQRPRKKKDNGPRSGLRKIGKKLDILPDDIQLKLDDDKVIILTQPQKMKTGGRAGYKNAGSVKGCKMAKAGKGRAYGNNS